ncbi:hypothetical protein BH23THE1_BH23THE1_21060 [soil metagenome]
MPGLSVSGVSVSALVPVNLAGRFDITALSLITATSPGDWNVIEVTAGLGPHSPAGLTARDT